MKTNKKINTFLYTRAFTESRAMLDNGIRNKSFSSGNFNFEIDTGYEMLHGTNYFSYAYTASYNASNDSYTFNVVSKWFDNINPNKKYAADSLLSGTLNVFYDPQDYNVSITWRQVFVI